MMKRLKRDQRMADLLDRLKDYLGVDAPPSSVYQMLHGLFGNVGAPRWLPAAADGRVVMFANPLASCPTLA